MANSDSGDLHTPTVTELHAAIEANERALARERQRAEQLAARTRALEAADALPAAPRSAKRGLAWGMAVGVLAAMAIVVTARVQRANREAEAAQRQLEAREQQERILVELQKLRERERELMERERELRVEEKAATPPPPKRQPSHGCPPGDPLCD